MNNPKRILRIFFEGFSTVAKSYSKCILLMRECDFSKSYLYETISSRNFVVCSEIIIDLLIESRCEENGGDLWKAYLIANNEGYSFQSFEEPRFSKLYFYDIPRFSESDFENIIEHFGGSKIAETTSMTPDFILGNIAIELKDLQKESLFNDDRRTSIAKIFKTDSRFSININFSNLDPECQKIYKRTIANSIKNVISKASKQIKEFQKIKSIDSSGVFILNTGYFSLDHSLLKEIVQETISKDTKTIKFAYIFTQSVYHNAVGDLQTDYKQDLIGIMPDKLDGIYEACLKIINQKMSSIFQAAKNSSPTASPQYPISFFADNKIFYWTPPRIEPSIKI
ncbi:hypothetical protein [Flavobacterium aquidurense]|uniref:hypothetical protein n=2 Tax=Flavobacterium TaxID=237 RepID=UPI000F4E5FD1|nr:hypothetical protein [Flavobacterium aquidurense]